MSRVIAICGTAPSSRLLVNQEPPETERWVQNACRIFVRQIDRFFELHSKQWMYQRLKNPQAYVEYQHWLQHFEGPLYLGDLDPVIPTAKRYPFERMIAKFGVPVTGLARGCPRFDVSPSLTGHDLVYANHLKALPETVDADAAERIKDGLSAYICRDCGYAVTGYFTSSIAYMLAMAIDELQPGDRITLYGINMSSWMEYAHQRDGCEYYLGWARAIGIDITVPKSSPILKNAMYARTEQSPMTVELVEERIRKLKESEKRHEAELINIRAQVQDNEYWLDVLNGVNKPTPVPEGRAVMLTPNGQVPEGIVHSLKG